MYCCPQAGHFYVNSEYDIKREYYDWFLMIYICDGTMIFERGGESFTARAGQIVLLDCHDPHRYYCQDHADFMWFHFFGNSSAEYIGYLTEQGKIVFTGENVANLRPVFSGILRQAGAPVVDEHLLSRDICNILCALATSRKSASILTSVITPAIHYIFSHYGEEIGLDQLAELCLISKPHLIRSFRKELNCTPHDYLLDYRLRAAKHMLSGTGLSVEEISEKCGFNSVSHFSRAFRKKIKMSPSEFRKMW